MPSQPPRRPATLNNVSGVPDICFPIRSLIKAKPDAEAAQSLTRWIDALNQKAKEYRDGCEDIAGWNPEEANKFRQWCRQQGTELKSALEEEENLSNVTLHFPTPEAVCTWLDDPVKENRPRIRVDYHHASSAPIFIRGRRSASPPLRSLAKSAFIPDSRRGPLTWGVMKARGRWA